MNDMVYFAEKNTDRSDIFVINLSRSTIKAKKCKIFSLHAKMIAIEIDNSNQVIQKDKNALFVLSDDQKVRHL